MVALQHPVSFKVYLQTFRISAVRELGPLEKNAATRGARHDPITVLADEINEVGFLIMIS